MTGKERNQHRLLLLIIAQGLKSVSDNHSYARLDVKQAVERGAVYALQAKMKWPGWENKAWITERIGAFGKLIKEDTPQRIFHSAKTFVRISDRIVTDLIEEERGSILTMPLIEPVYRNIQTVIDFIDGDGVGWGELGDANWFVDEVYKIIGVREFT
ncbi:MAG TPA: hypothetical protein DCS09_07390 [Porphyromonadaceae bacterium]|nr:hypothetical protein [Porphyromonadaceae bacterium]